MSEEIVELTYWQPSRSFSFKKGDIVRVRYGKLIDKVGKIAHIHNWGLITVRLGDSWWQRFVAPPRYFFDVELEKIDG